MQIKFSTQNFITEHNFFSHECKSINKRFYAEFFFIVQRKCFTVFCPIFFAQKCRFGLQKLIIDESFSLKPKED